MIGLGLGVATLVFPPIFTFCSWLIGIIVVLFAYTLEAVISFLIIIILIVLFSDVTFGDIFSTIGQILLVLFKYFIMFLIPLIVVAIKEHNDDDFDRK